MRTFDPEVREVLRGGMERVFRGVTEAHGARLRSTYVEGYAALINDETAAGRVEAAARAELGDDAFVDAEPIMGGEDFSAYLEKAPGAFFFVGAGGEGAFPHHHPRFTLDESRVPPGHRRLRQHGTRLPRLTTLRPFRPCPVGTATCTHPRPRVGVEKTTRHPR